MNGCQDPYICLLEPLPETALFKPLGHALTADPSETAHVGFSKQSSSNSQGFITATKYLSTLPPGWAVRDTPGLDICRVSGHISLEHSAHCCGSRSLADPRKPRALVPPQYPTTVSLLGTHFYTEGSSADSSVGCCPIQEGERGPGQRGKGSHTGPQDLTFWFFLYQELTM